MKTGRGVRLPTHRCNAKDCKAMVPRKHLFCEEHYSLLPAWLKAKLHCELQYGIAWKCHPTDKYLQLRATAIQLAIAAGTKATPAPLALQLPLTT